MPTPMTLPFDLQTDQDAIARKQQIAQALLGQMMQMPQGQMVSGHFVAPNPLQYLAQAAGTYFGGKMVDQADDAKRELAGKYNNALAAGLQKYFDTRDGKPGQTRTTEQAEALLRDDKAPPELAEPIKADPRKAAIDALTSGIGPLQQLGQMDLQQIGKSALTPKDLLSLTGFDPKSRLLAAMGGGLSVLTPERKEHVVNGQIVIGTPDTGYSPVADVRDKFGDVGVIGQGEDGKPIYGQKNVSTGEAKFAPKGVQVNVDTTQKAGDKFATELAGKRADLLAKSYDNATAASKAIDAIENAENDVNAGIKSGASGQVALGVAKFAKSLGLDADPQIANTEAFRANMARETLNLVKGLGAGTGISNADREFAEKASGGSILLDDQAIVRLMNIAKAAAGNVMLGHMRLLNAQQGATGTLPQDLETFKVPFTMRGNDQLIYDETGKKFIVKPPAQPPKTVAPATPGKTAPGTISVQEWLSK